MTALIVDDEPLARAFLSQLLIAQGIEVVGQAGDADEALTLAEELMPDVVFLDIRMPGTSGIEATSAFGTLDPAPFVILVSGYSDHALEAFERSALDYLLKPVSSDRLELAIGKVRRQLTLRRRANRALPTRTVQRLPIRIKGSYRIVPVETIFHASSSDKSVVIKTRNGEYRTNYTLAYLEQVLPSNFMRVHSSCIVNLSSVEELVLLGNHTYAVKLVSGEELPVGRQHYSKLQQKLGFPSQA